MRWKVRKKYIIFACIGIILVGLSVWHFWPWKVYGGLEMRPEWTVAENIMQSPVDQIFATALYGAGYNTFLQEDGPFTVFVPTDKSYGNLTPGTRGYISNSENEGEARQMLLYHVVKGRYMNSDIKDGMTLETVQGEDLKFSWKDGYLVINGYSYVETPNIVSKNGIIHITTNYLLPPSILDDSSTLFYEMKNPK